MNILLLLIPLLVQSAKLNVPRVLLPYNHDISSNFTLKVHEGGCYKWTSSRDEVRLTEIFTDGMCSNEAVVSAITKSPTRLTAIILAKDIDTGFSLRCDVIVDSIHRLEIVTTTRELFVEEAPEEFEVRAYDLYGNEFSTLEGQVFVWDLQTITDHKAVVPAQTVLRFITFEASPYETPPAIAPIEAIGEQGSRVLIEGRQTGLARLSVRMAHSSYKNLQAAEVNLMVIANLILEPQDVYILPRTTIQYSVWHLKQGIFHPVEIEGSQYYLQIVDESVAYLEEDGISASGLILGTTSVILRDNNVQVSQTVKQPTATLNVVDPSYLTITIMPHNNPALIVNYQYTFLVNVYDRNNNKIYLTDAIVVDTMIPSDFITTEYKSKNGTYIEGIPHQIGTTKITAKLTAIEVNYEIIEISPPLKGFLTVDIYDRIRVLPSVLLLPWDPITTPYYNFNLTTKGAQGPVSWSSKDASLVQVNTLGQCQTFGQGMTSVLAALTINPHNNDEAKIYIQEILSLNILEGQFEVEVDHPLTLAIAMGSLVKGAEMRFVQCHQLPLKVITQDDFYSSDFKLSSVNESCVSVDLKSSSSGFSTASVSYQSSKGLLEDSVTISAFKPLRPISPKSGETVLAIGTSRTILFEGGPLPWIKKPSSHFAKVEYEKLEVLTAEVMDARSKDVPDVHAVFVECSTLGEIDVTLHVGNKPSPSLPFPVKTSSSVKVICALPDSMTLSSATPKKEGCPDGKDVHTVVAHCYKPFAMRVSVRDSEGRNFDNVSSLFIGWSVSDSALASFSQEDTHLVNTQLVHGFRVPIAVQQNLIPFGAPGELSVTATITSFRYPSLKDVQIPKLQDSIKVLLVKDAQLSPAELILFNHKENQGEVLITGGSGHFKLAKFDEEIAMYEYIPQNNKIIVIPIADGNTSLILRDLCLDLATMPVSVIRISSLGSLDLLMRDRVEVEMSITAEVVARDTSGMVIPYHALMNITPHPYSNIIDLSFETVNERGNANYLVHGKSVGSTTLKMSVQKGSSFMYSPTRPLQVFPALTIYPRNLTLIVGAVFQVETRGGPFPDCTIDFIMENETISSVSYAGVVTALSLGITRLTARAVGLLSDGEEMIVYSQDSVLIRVIPLESIHIHSPLKHIETGYSMPLYALGSDPSLNPLSYGTVIPPLLFEWSLSNKQIASFKTLYSENGIVESKENQGIVRLKAFKPGRVSVSLKVSVTVPHSAMDYQIKSNAVLTDKIELRVFETLKLKNPIKEDGKILLSPNAEAKIITNRDSEGTVSYRVNCNDDSETASLVTVSSDGIVKAGNRIGDTSVLIFLEEEFGVTQSISILVEVRPISYLEMDTSTFMKAAGKNLFSVVPVGVSHEIKVRAHDHRGRVFTATSIALEFRPSSYDLTNIQRGSTNDTINVSVRNVGQTVLQVWDNNNPLLVDYFKINSGPGIDPDKASIPFGSFVCFFSNLRNTAGEIGTWKSDSSALEIDPLLGIGIAYQVSKVSVSYQVSDTVGTTTELYIVPITKISIHPPSEILSNIKKENASFIKVSFEGDHKLSPWPVCFPQTVSFSPNIPFTCILSFDSVLPNTLHKNIFRATANYIPGEGFGCVLESLFDSDSLFATSGVKLKLGVSVIKSGLQEDVETPSVDISFLPAAFPEKTDVMLTDIDQTAVVVVHGSETLLSSFSLDFDDRYIHTEIESIETAKCNVVISSKDGIWSGAVSLNPVSVSLISSLTQQKIKIDIIFEKIGSDTCPDPGKRIGIVSFLVAVASHYQNALFSILCLAITIVCLLFGYYSLASPGYKQTQNTGVFASSSSAPQPLVTPGSSTRNRPVSPFSPISSSSTPEASSLRHIPPQSPKGISLWSVDQEPVYGDPLFRSSPRPAYDGSPTYTRNPTVHH